MDESADEVLSHSEVSNEGILVDLVIRSDFRVFDNSWSGSLHDDSSSLFTWSTGDVLGNKVELVRLSFNSLEHTDHEWIAWLGQEVINSNEVEVVDSELGPFLNESISFDGFIDTSITISRHGELEFAVHEDISLHVESWELSLLEEVDILLPESEVEVLSEELSGDLIILIGGHDVDVDGGVLLQEGLVWSVGSSESLNGSDSIKEDLEETLSTGKSWLVESLGEVTS